MSAPIFDVSSPGAIHMKILSDLSRKQQIRIAAVVGGVVLIGVSAILLTRGGSGYTPPAYTLKVQKEVERHVRSVGKVPATDRDAIRSLFMEAPVFPVGGAMMSESSRADLASYITEFIASRATGDADAYADAMRARGARIKVWDEFHPAYLRRYLLATGREAGPGDDAYEIFRVSMEYELRSGRRDNGLTVSIAAGPHTADIQLAEIRAGDDPYSAFFPLLMEIMEAAQQYENIRNIRWSDNLAQIHWYMTNSSSSGASHWAPPASLDDVLAVHGAALVANVRFFQRFARGAIYPTTALLYLDPDADLWRPISISYHNIDFKRGGGGPVY